MDVADSAPLLDGILWPTPNGGSSPVAASDILPGFADELELAYQQILPVADVPTDGDVIQTVPLTAAFNLTPVDAPVETLPPIVADLLAPLPTPLVTLAAPTIAPESPSADIPQPFPSDDQPPALPPELASAVLASLAAVPLPPIITFSAGAPSPETVPPPPVIPQVSVEPPPRPVGDAAAPELHTEPPPILALAAAQPTPLESSSSAHRPAAPAPLPIGCAAPPDMAPHEKTATPAQPPVKKPLPPVAEPVETASTVPPVAPPKPVVPESLGAPLDVTFPKIPQPEARAASPSEKPPVAAAAITAPEAPPLADRSADEPPPRERPEPPQAVASRPDRPQDALPLPSPADHATDVRSAAGPVWSQSPIAASSPVLSDSRGTVSVHDSRRLIERIADAVSHGQNSGRELVLELSPPDYGPVRIEVRETAGLVTARLETQTQNAERVLAEHLPQLHEALASRGTSLNRIDVVRFDGGERSGQGFSDPHWTAAGQQQPQPEPQPTTRRRRTDVRTEPATAAITGPANAPLGLQELNVRV